MNLRIAQVSLIATVMCQHLEALQTTWDEETDKRCHPPPTARRHPLILPKPHPLGGKSPFCDHLGGGESYDEKQAAYRVLGSVSSTESLSVGKKCAGAPDAEKEGPPFERRGRRGCGRWRRGRGRDGRGRR